MGEDSEAKGRRRRWLVLAGLLAALAVVVALAAADWRRAAGAVAALPDARASLDALAAAAAMPGPTPILPGWTGRPDAATVARDRYRAAATAQLPPAVAASLAAELSVEGGSLALYDALRVAEIVEGTAAWRPAFVAGWLESRPEPALAALAPHVAALDGPQPFVLSRDLVAEARAIAAEGNPAAFAWLELARDPAVQALPGWSPLALSGAAETLTRRSGRPLDAAIPGLATDAGWRLAVRLAPAAAADAAEAMGRLFGTGIAVEPAALLAEQRRRTLDVWSAELADLRVRPLADHATALAVTAQLASDATPLSDLIRAAWREAGGDDPARADAVRATLGPARDFVESGRMQAVADLFGAVHAVLAGTGDKRTPHGAAIAVLDAAPREVADLVEPALIETVGTEQRLRRPAVALTWRSTFAGACRYALAGRYPFGTGPDADPVAVRRLIGAGGTLEQFAAMQLATLLDRRASPWIWRPEAALAGFDPASAAFFEDAATAGAALFPPAGVTVAPPLAEAAAAGPWDMMRALDAGPVRRLDDGRRVLLGTGTGRRGLRFDRTVNPASAHDAIRGLACPEDL